MVCRYRQAYKAEDELCGSGSGSGGGGAGGGGDGGGGGGGSGSGGGGGGGGSGGGGGGRVRRLPVRFYIRAGAGVEVKAWSEVTTVSAPIATRSAFLVSARAKDRSDRGGLRLTLGDALESIGVSVSGGGSGGGLSSDSDCQTSAPKPNIDGCGGTVCAVVQGVAVALGADLETLHAQLKGSDHFLHVCVLTS